MKVLILTSLFERIDREWPLPGGPMYRYRGPREYVVRVPGLVHDTHEAALAVARVREQLTGAIEYSDDSGKESITTAIALPDGEETVSERGQREVYGTVFFPAIEIPCPEQAAA